MPLLSEIIDSRVESWAILIRKDQTAAEVLSGEVSDLKSLLDIPLGKSQKLVMIPFAQIGERGYEVAHDDTPLRIMDISKRQEIATTELIEALPDYSPEVEIPGFDISDAEYEIAVEAVIRDEIGGGEGANFVIRRDFIAVADLSDGSTQRLALSLLRKLLISERGAYWTFAIVTPGQILVGASPERHISVKNGVTTMNPISGTFRHTKGNPDPLDFIDFLGNQKEVGELFMVVDEELKMMSEICSSGGYIHGPYLKQMSRLTHTEYLLRGHTDLDVREVLLRTMFAPTVTGAPIENACTIIKKYEKRPRGYYSGVLALISPNDQGSHDLDAPILIRTAQIFEDGQIRISAGATLVRNSNAHSEAQETLSKASGLLSAFGFIEDKRSGRGNAKADTEPIQLDSIPEVQAALASRNRSLAEFWLQEQAPHPVAAFSNKSVLIVDFEDRFTTMIGHQLRHLGLQVDIVRWEKFDHSKAEEYDLLLSGPGPGDPENITDARIAAVHKVVRARLKSAKPLLAVCLSHQVLSLVMGLRLEKLAAPRQGVQLEVPLQGRLLTIGFYNTFTAKFGALPEGVSADFDGATGDVFGLSGPGFSSVQGHVESVLSKDGLRALELLVSSALGLPA